MNYRKVKPPTKAISFAEKEARKTGPRPTKEPQLSILPVPPGGKRPNQPGPRPTKQPVPPMTTLPVPPGGKGPDGSRREALKRAMMKMMERRQGQ